MTSHTALKLADPLTTDADRGSLAGAATEDRWGATLVALGRRAVASADVELLMHDASAMLAESLDADLSGVGELVDDGSQLVVELRSAREGVELDARGQSVPVRAESSLAGFALAEGRPVAVPDLGRETRFVDLLLRKHHVESAIACPLKLSGKTYGTLLVGNLRPQQFSEDDLLFVEAIGHLITTTIARERAEQALAAQLRLDAAVLDTIEAMVIVLDPELRIQQFNRHCQEIAGFSLGELRQRPFSNAFLVPAEVRGIKDMLDRLQRGVSAGPVEFESYVLTKHGTRRRVAWAFTRLTAVDGTLESLVGTGIDITEKCDLEAKLARAHALAADRSAAAAPDMAPGTPSDPSPAEDALQNARPFQQLPPGVFGDRRSRPRRAYPYVQLMAPYSNGQLPPPDQFREVQCRDIGAGGFSFFAPGLSAEADVVVAFGAGESLTYLTARRIHATPTSRDGQSCYIVGCRYTGRASYQS